MRNKTFRNKLAGGLLLLVLLIAFLPYYFAFIESRKGVVLNDLVLDFIESQCFYSYIHHHLVFKLVVLSKEF